MGILSSATFWIIVIIVMLIMALIGYIAEGTNFANKALEKPKEPTISEITPKINNETPVTPENINNPQPIEEASIVNTDFPIEPLNMQEKLENFMDNSNNVIPSAWDGSIPVEDKRMETIHTENNIDDWTMPSTVNNENQTNTISEIDGR